MKTIDINCDLGEGETAADLARDAQIMRFISRCNIACGGHAGNATTMALSLENALNNKLAAGAHPGYPDRENFGRVSLPIEHGQLLDSIWEQIQRLETEAGRMQIALSHIKLHGALYNDAEANDQLAKVLVDFIHKEFPHLQILGLANAAMERAAKKLNHPFLREGFMDRRYLNAHRLSPRSMPGAVIEEFDQCLQQVLALASGATFGDIDNTPLQFSVDSICLHGDTPGAERTARKLQQALRQAGFKLGPSAS
ncbi:LamB/YcsF family protein [Microbulbifer celer]|uniref:LamB/YcsF family protein n=1 Tax=Microbulbifer celer TaxID=435905 RepID=A0ABW3UDR0_9GAMM|nr:LamB/YcsF family protein [Microbulbifer celer]UFN56261.1 LamB/YcsF family protein [Microbulbifer celer]